MPRELTIMFVRGGGQAPLALRLGSLLTFAFVATAITLGCLWAGWQIGELTFAM